jgi:WD40-like Beta Propeller Repeat
VLASVHFSNGLPCPPCGDPARRPRLRLWKRPPTPTGPQMASTPPPAISLPDPVNYDVIHSHRLCFERLSPVIGESGVFVIDASARRAWGFAETADFTGGLFNSPAISPDGQRIAYSSLGAFWWTFWDIFVIPAEGGVPVVGAAGPGNDALPTWTPGSVLLWADDEKSPYSLSHEAVSVTGARVLAVLVSPAGLYIRVGSDYRPLVSAGANERYDAPAFRPDGTELAWIREQIDPVSYGFVRIDILVGDANGARPERIASLPLAGGLMGWSGGNNQSLAWSPDGRQLAFNYATSSTTGHIFVVDRYSGKLTQITSKEGVGDRSVSWSYLPRP